LERVVSSAGKPTYQFGPFRLDGEKRILYQDGQRVPLTPKVLDTLIVLLENHGQIVEKNELMRRVWADAFVEEGNLTVNIFLLRKVLGKGLNGTPCIETIPKRGYRFAASLQIAGPTTIETLPSAADGARTERSADKIESRLSDSWTREPWNPLKPGRIRRARPRRIGPRIAVGVAGTGLVVVLGWSFLQPPKPLADLTQRRLTFDSSEKPVQSGAISPNGRYLAFTDSGGIHVRLLSTGDERLISRPSGVPADAEWSVRSWFPDSTQLLAEVRTADAQQSMWTASLLGRPPRELHEGGAGGEVSPDGKLIAFAPEVGRGIGSTLGASDPYSREVWVMGSRGDGPHRVCFLGESEALWSLHWSPAGDRLAYIRARQSLQKGFQVWVETCDLKGANRRAVVSDPGIEEFRWLPNGRIIYSREDSQYPGSDNLWQIDVNGRSGLPTGQPKRITQWAGSYLKGLSVTADGKSLLFRKTTFQTRCYLGELRKGGRHIYPPTRLTGDDANDTPIGWTTDGTAILMFSNRSGTSGIFKKTIGQDTIETVVTGQQVRLPARFSADGALILYLEASTTGEPSAPLHMMRVPAEGGPAKVVMETRGNVDFGCARLPAHLCSIIEGSADGKEATLTAFDPLQGRGKILRSILQEPTAPFDITALSPDGSTFAISRRAEAEIHIQLLSLSGGSDRTITVKGWPNLTGLDWSSSGKGLYLGSRTPGSSTLLYLDLTGDVQVVWQFKAGVETWGIPSPDGRYLAIMSVVSNSNLWMLEGF
jgi:DNA-binding winged helix-turn-helix (wHTH) protein/Tol biopolymer transport system component